MAVAAPHGMGKLNRASNGNYAMNAELPAGWRQDLRALGIHEAARWLANLNASYPWRDVVGHIRLDTGRELVLKFHSQREAWERELAAARFLSEPGSPALAPALIGAVEARLVLAFEYVAGPDLVAVLDSMEAPTAWRTAVQAIAGLHTWALERQDRWLDIWPRDRDATRLPDYDLAIDVLLEPFRSAGAVTPELVDAIASARQAVAEPGPWLGFTHSDLQTRHLVWTAGGLRIVDWEGAGLRHRLYDLACLLDKPTNHERRLPQAAQAQAVTYYARACGLDAGAVHTALMPVLAYERLIGIAETYPAVPAQARASAEDLIALTQHDSTYAPLAGAAARLLPTLPEAELPWFAGL